MSSYLIIDNEGDSIKIIEEIINDFHDFYCLGVTNDRDESMNIILKESPDIVFINIDNSFENPFQFISELYQYAESIPKFVAISKTKDKAYNAIKNNFFDYLLTPLKEVDLRIAIKKFQKNHPPINKKTICLKSYKDYHYLDTDEILYLEADNNTTDFHMQDGNTINAFKTLKTFEELLPDNFSRIHKSYIVNSNYVMRINYGKRICIIKSCNCIIPFTKTYINSIELMNNLLSQSTSF